MQLPLGVYVVKSDFPEDAGEICFSFKGDTYTAQMGVNAFSCLEDFVKADLQPAQKAFCGYAGTPILLFPTGTYDASLARPGQTKLQRLCCYFPQAITILGENAGISPNGPDLRTPNPRWKEASVFYGLWDFGGLGIMGKLPGTLTVDGLVFENSKIADDRTGGDDLQLVIKNCAFTGFSMRDLIFMEPLADPAATRQTVLENIRCDGILALGSESRLIDFYCGDLTVENMYFGNTDKFPGLTNFLQNKPCGRPGEKASITYRKCLFENCTAPTGLGFCMPDDSQMTLNMIDCIFQDVSPKGTSPLFVHLPTADCRLALTNCAFTGPNACPTVVLAGNPDAQLCIRDTTVPEHSCLIARKPPRKTAPQPTEAIPIDDPHTVAYSDFAQLDSLYAGMSAYHGDTHTHTDSGGTSDGATPLGEFVQQLKALDMDFAAVVDHRQMRHFFLPEWDETMLICGSEPAGFLQDREGRAAVLHYCMLFPDKEGLGKTLAAFPEFEYTGGTNGSFRYPRVSTERFCQLGAYIWDIGGLMSHAHPKQMMASNNPLDYYFGDHVALETVHGDVSSYSTKCNRDLWVTLLAMGKRLRTYGSTDTHESARNDGQTTLYAKKPHSRDFFNAIRAGNCTAGSAGIQMAIGDTPMGGALAYKPGLTLQVRAGDYHPTWKQDAVYRLNVFTDKGLAYATEFVGATPVQLALFVEKRAFYRVEITNESDGHTATLGNPIWLD